jgi:hypothetical protein
MIDERKHLREMKRYKINGYNEAFVIASHSVYGLPDSYVTHILHPLPFPPTIPLPLWVNIIANRAVTLKKERGDDAIFYNIELQFLIDGQDIDESWCERYLSGEPYDYVVRWSTRQGKKDRIGKIKYYGQLTTYVSDEEERQKVLTTIGREMDLLLFKELQRNYLAQR